MKLEWFIIGTETVLLALALLYVSRFLKKNWLFVEVNSFIRQYEDAEDALDEWEAARPFLVHSACPYAVSLLSDMIVAYAYLLEHGFRDDVDHLEMLIALLGIPPSDYDPPETIGGSFYLRKESTTSRNETTNQTPLRIANGILSSMKAYPTKISEPTALATSYDRESARHLPD
jgi:hypothetical protein